MPRPVPGATVVVVPPLLALLPEHASLTDPVPDLRAAVAGAVRDLLADREPGATPVAVLAAPPTPDDVRRGVGASAGRRVAAALLGDVPHDVVTSVPTAADAVLVLANGSAARGEKAPGHHDERAHGFDDALSRALTLPDASALHGLDVDLGATLWAEVAVLPALGAFLADREAAGATWVSETSYDADPFGVRYWVVRLTARPSSSD